MIPHTVVSVDFQHWKVYTFAAVLHSVGSIKRKKEEVKFRASNFWKFCLDRHSSDKICGQPQAMNHIVIYRKYRKNF